MLVIPILKQIYSIIYSLFVKLWGTGSLLFYVSKSTHRRIYGTTVDLSFLNITLTESKSINNWTFLLFLDGTLNRIFFMKTIIFVFFFGKKYIIFIIWVTGIYTGLGEALKRGQFLNSLNKAVPGHSVATA